MDSISNAQDLADQIILLVARVILLGMGLVHFDGLPGLLILLFAGLSLWPLAPALGRRIRRTGRPATPPGFAP